MKAVVIAFAFGRPNTLRSNRRIAKNASTKAIALGCAIYTQRDAIPVKAGIEVQLVAEDYPRRVPTLRIARGAVRWAITQDAEELWLCAAEPHRARCLRDVCYAAREINAVIDVRVCDDKERCAPESWFCRESLQRDTRGPSRWRIRDFVLMHLPMRLYAFIAG